MNQSKQTGNQITKTRFLTLTILILCTVRRIFLLGAPGACRQENLEALSEYFEWKRISTGKLLREHVQSSGPHADRITACFNNFQFGKSDSSLAYQLVVLL